MANFFDNIIDQVRTDGFYINATYKDSSKIRYKYRNENHKFDIENPMKSPYYISKPIKLFKYGFLSKLMDLFRYGRTSHNMYSTLIFKKKDDGYIDIYYCKYKMDFMDVIIGLKNRFEKEHLILKYEVDGYNIKIVSGLYGTISSAIGNPGSGIKLKYKTILFQREIEIVEEYRFIPFIDNIPTNFTYSHEPDRGMPIP